MARVNHKKVRQLLNEKRSKISDRQFFSSRILAGHYEDMAAAITRRYNHNRRVRVSLYWNPKDESLALTDNLYVRINCGNAIVTQVRGRENRYEIVTGLFAHELGHILYTDFLAGQTYVRYIEKLRWYPAPPPLTSYADQKREEEFWEYAKDEKNMRMIQYLAHFISNIIEDGYIENKMLVNFPGSLGYGLESLREVHFEEMPTVTQLIEKEETEGRHIFESILQLMLSYSKFGRIKYGDEPLSDERISAVFGLINDIDGALCNNTGKSRLISVSTILIRCWDYIRDFIEICKQRQQDAENKGDASDAGSILSEILASVTGTSPDGTVSNVPIADMTDEKAASATSSEREKTRAHAAKSASAKSDADSVNANSDDGQSVAESGEQDTDNAGEGNSQSEDGTMSVALSASPGCKQDVSEAEGGRIPLENTEELYAPDEGVVEHDPEYEREKYDKAASDIERVLERMAERAACEQLENDRLRELNDAAKSISYGDIHSGVNVCVHRIASVDEDLIDQYNAVSTPLLKISRQLQRSLIQQLKDNRRGGKQTGLLMGRRLDAHTLHRNDGKVFYKNSLPNEIPELAVGLLLDESGSMSCGDRATYARASAIILYDFCRSLGIPIMVYGHSTGYSNNGHTIDLYSYAEFDGIDNDDQYRMMDISARNCNRDGAALRYVAEQLSKRSEDVKILILVSDGQPSDIGYGGTAAEEDLRGIKQEYVRRGILFIAAAIGDDKDAIQRIYGSSFLDITDLEQFPTKLTAIVKRHIKV